MASYTVRVDTSFYGDSSVRDASVVGVAFEVIDTSNGSEKTIFEGKWGDIIEIRDSTEAEFVGVKKAVDKVAELSSDDRVVVVKVVCDADSALESLEAGDERYEVVSEILDVAESFYSVTWSAVNRSEMWDIDDTATRVQRRVRDSEGYE